MMCVVGKSIQGGPGSHITRVLSEVRGTFYCLRGLRSPAKEALALSRGTALEGCGGEG